MASIHKYSTSKGETRYLVSYRRPDNSQSTRRGFKTKKEAAAFRLSMEHSRASGSYIDPTAGRITIGALAPVWFGGKAHMKPSGLRSEESAWATHVEPKWANRAINTIRRSEIQTWASELSATRSATTVIRVVGVLRGTLQLAVDDHLLSVNPAIKLNLPKKRPARRNYLNHERVHLLASEAGKNATLVYFLAYTGLRWGEAAALKVNAYNPLNRRVAVVSNAVDVAGTFYIDSPKSNRHRSISVPFFLAERLAEVVAGRRPDEFIFGDGLAPLHPPHSRSGWLAHAVRRCQLVDEEFPRITPHELCHTAASLAIAVQKNPKLVQNMLGHASAAHTLDIYADLFPDDMDRLADGLDEAIAHSAVVTPLSRRTA